jgi:hypothetical protein
MPVTGIIKMSLSVFIMDISKEDLTLGKLREIWSHFNIVNKSLHIDILMNVLHKQLTEKATKESIDLNQVSFPPKRVAKICEHFRNQMIKKCIGTTTVDLTAIPMKVQGTQSSWRMDTVTGIIFRPSIKNPSEWIAIRVLAMGKAHPLGLQHMSICVSLGWPFETNRNDICSPFRVIE